MLTFNSAVPLMSTVTGMVKAVPPVPLVGVTTTFPVQVPAVIPAVIALTVTVAGVLELLEAAFNQFAGQLDVAVMAGTVTEKVTGCPELVISTPCADGG